MRFIDLQEGPNDPGIFKAIFLAGGPGSGKGYVAQQLGLQARGLKVINSDDAFEYLMRKRDLSFDMPPEQQADRDVARQRAKEITTKKQDLYLDGRLGIIIDGTAKDPNKMAKLKAELESIGYQTMMVFVNTSLRTALQRNLLRDRKVPTDIVMQSHKQVQDNKNSLAEVFAADYVEVNNDDNANFNEPLKRIDKFISAPVTAQARDWISKASVQRSIAQEDVQSKPKVYVDMDGVLANFYAGVTRVTGHEEPRDMALQDIEDTMASFKGTDFFYKLPKYEQTDQLIAMVNAATKGDWYILSSPLKYDREGSAKYKAAWIRDKLKIQPKDMYFQSDKAQFATQPDGTPNILIDDYPKYLNSWKDKGGIGVQYKGHAGNIEDVKATLDQHFGAGVEETVQIDELADKPYSYSQNVKTPDKRAYRFQTDAGQLYRVQVFNRRKDDANKLEIHFDLTNMKTGKPESGVTGSGDAVRVFSTVADILQKEVANQDPTGVIIASKADDESRVKLYRTLARRATKLMPGYEVSGERTVTGASGDPYLTIELKKS
jgi:predicted kinase